MFNWILVQFDAIVNLVASWFYILFALFLVERWEEAEKIGYQSTYFFEIIMKHIWQNLTFFVVVFPFMFFF